jgi:hypothetical protein
MLVPNNFGVTVAPGRRAFDVRHAAFYQLGISESDRVAEQMVTSMTLDGSGTVSGTAASWPGHVCRGTKFPATRRADSLPESAPC